MPVYIINPGQHLIRAASRSQALRFVAEKTLKAEVAKGETIADLMAKGVKCEDARTPETADLPLEKGAHSDPKAPPAFQNDTDTGLYPVNPETAPPADPFFETDAVDNVTLEGIDHVI